MGGKSMTVELTQQQADVLWYMQTYGSITMYDGFNDLDMTKVNTRISELRAKGYNILDKWESHKNRRGVTKRYKRYYLG